MLFYKVGPEDDVLMDISLKEGFRGLFAHAAKNYSDGINSSPSCYLFYLHSHS